MPKPVDFAELLVVEVEVSKVYLNSFNSFPNRSPYFKDQYIGLVR